MTTTETVFEAGVYDDMPEDIYHSCGWALSCSGAKKLLPPSCPALYAYDRATTPVPKRHFELGTAAHRMVLGLGAEWVLLDYPDYRTKAAQQARDEARAHGAVPVLPPEYEQIKAMAEALRTHHLASSLLCRGDVQAEQSLFWRDEEWGITRRARLDALRVPGPGNMLNCPVVADYKSTTCAEPGAFTRDAARYGYHMQDAWYRDAVTALLGDEPEFFFVAQEKTPPYLVSVIQLDDAAVAAGRRRNAQAMEIFRDCQAVDIWPGYNPGDIVTVSLPTWATREDYDL